jgi:hypothetical protein
MVKYATALRLGTAETEAILRRFTRSNVQHPTYKALAELGKAIKTLFLCRYLHEETLRREIHEGLNVIEHWNGANDFVFFARRGELASNRTEDHELSMLALHLLQNCIVYINTLMMQQVLARPHWAERLTATDLRALTPLIWEHVNPVRPLRAQYGNPARAQSKWPLMTRLLGEPIMSGQSLPENPARCGQGPLFSVSFSESFL